MKKKWTLHILCQKGSAHSIAPIYAVAINRETAGRGGGIHTVPYPSWDIFLRLSPLSALKSRNSLI